MLAESERSKMYSKRRRLRLTEILELEKSAGNG
jgi:hypothetical protein